MANHYKRYLTQIKKPALWAGIILASIFWLGFLFVKSQGIDSLIHDNIQSELAVVTSKHAEIGREILSHRYQLSVNYDGISEKLNDFHRYYYQLKENLKVVGADKKPVIRDQLAAVDKYIESYNLVVEDFKSHNALLKNSLSYIFSKIAQINTNKDIDVRLFNTLNSIKTTILMVHLGRQTESYEAQLRNHLSDLEGLISTSSSNIRDVLSLLIKHVNLSIGIEHEMVEWLSATLNEDKSIVDLPHVFNHWVLDQVWYANVYRHLLFLSAISMFFVLGWIYIRLNNRSTELRTALKNLKLLKYALDQHAIVSIANVRGNISYVNDRFCEISGFKREELIGKNHRIVKSNEHSPRFYRNMWQTITRGDMWHGELKNAVKSGGHYWVYATIVPFLDDFGKPDQYISIRTDITSQKKMESDLSRQQHELMEAKLIAEEASNSKSMFLANMSHEIRTPMNAIIGMAHLALQTDLNKRQRDYVEKIHQAGNALIGIINDILDFSKIEAGKLSVEMTNFTLSDVLDNVSTVISPLAAKKNLEILLEVASRIPNTLIGDPLRLSQIIVNLASNAVKFTESGDIKINIIEEQREDRRVKLRFMVKDQGIGMTQEEIERLFQAFSQADGSTTRRFGGTGLGLTISKQLVEMMDGEINVSSSPGEGSSFYFTAWFDVSPDAMEPSLLPTAIEGLRILVAEGRESSRQALIMAISSLPVDVVTAVSKQELIEELKEADYQENPIDLVIVNHPLRGCGVEEVAKAIRLNSGGQVPCKILVTHHTDVANISVVDELDTIDRTIVKPINPSHLVNIIFSIFDKTHEVKDRQSDTDHKRLSGMRVLVAEDNLVNQQIAQEVLQIQGAVVTIANNGLEAINLLEDQGLSAFDVVLMDLEMPEMNGHEATKKLRSEERFKALPIVAMTAHASIEEQEICKNEGMDAHLAKPVEPEKLYKLLQTWYKSSMKEFAIPTSEPQTKKPETVYIPDIAQLDIEQGLSIVGNDRSFYLKLLNTFSTSQADTIDRLSKALNKNDLQEVAQVAHALKGVSANIGAKEISKMAAILEDGAEGEVIQESMAEVLDSLTINLNHLLDDLKESLGESKSTTIETQGQEPVDDNALKEHLCGLIKLVSNGDGDAIDLFESNSSLFRNVLSDIDYTNLYDAIQQFDFNKAEIYLKIIAKDRDLKI